MERIHPRDMLSAGVRAEGETARDAAAVRDMTMSDTSASGSNLLRRGARIARSLLSPRKCIESASINTCEKPAASAGTLLGVLVGVGVATFFIILGILFMLHLRRKRRDEAEVINDPHELADYGLDEVAAGKKGGKGSSGSSKNNLSAPDVQTHRLSAQQLMEAQNPFGYGAELADSERVSTRKGSPPQYPGDAAVKM